MAKKIAEQLIETLVESGVERIYAVTGDSLNEVNEAVRKNRSLCRSSRSSTDRTDRMLRRQ